MKITLLNLFLITIHTWGTLTAFCHTPCANRRPSTQLSNSVLAKMGYTKSESFLPLCPVTEEDEIRTLDLLAISDSLTVCEMLVAPLVLGKVSYIKKVKKIFRDNKLLSKNDNLTPQQFPYLYRLLHS